MMTLPCLGGTNRTLTTVHGATWSRPFKRDERGRTIMPLEIETYHLDQHPELGDYWRHESLTTPEAIASALIERNAWQARHDAERKLSLFSGAVFPRWSQTPEGKMRLAAELENQERDELRDLQTKYNR